MKKDGNSVSLVEGDRREVAVLSGLEMIKKTIVFNEILKNDEEFNEFNLSLRKKCLKKPMTKYTERRYYTGFGNSLCPARIFLLR